MELSQSRRNDDGTSYFLIIISTSIDKEVVFVVYSMLEIGLVKFRNRLKLRRLQKLKLYDLLS